MPRRQHTVGVIGLGYGRAHIPAFQANGCTVVAVCQRDEASAKTIADRYGVPHVFGRWEDLLEQARPSIVVIATPPHLHRPIAERALALGADVLAEKPLAVTLNDARIMADAAMHAGRIAMTGFNWRFTAAMQRFNAMVRAGAVGRLFELVASWVNPRWADEATSPTWRMDRTQAGHGAMGDMGVHLVDMIRWNFGEFRRITAGAGVAHPSRTVPGGARPADAEDYCSVVAELESGAQATLRVCRVARGANRHGIEASGTAGALAYLLDTGTPNWWAGSLRAASGVSGFEDVEVEVPSVDGDTVEIIGGATVAPLVAHFLQAIESRATASPSFEDGMRAQAVLDAAMEAVSSRRWVDVRTPLTRGQDRRG
jgi:predicted dehydrogenase